jgi:hypothetical protein
MKRNAISLLVHPYRNILLPPAELKQAVDSFADSQLKLTTEFPNVRWNLCLPAHLVECMDSILLSKLREVQKRGNLEWLCCGYTEPFLSFSPVWLTQENIRMGVETLTSLTGAKPMGFAPPYSNWEPSHIPTLDAHGLSYAVLSRALFPAASREYLGYWATEHMGTSVLLFPVQMVHAESAPADVSEWLESVFSRGKPCSSGIKTLCIDYLLPLAPKPAVNPFDWLRKAAGAIEQSLLQYQTVRMDEVFTESTPLGLQYVAANLVFNREDAESAPIFQDYLHTFDQVGLMQRRLMEVAENIRDRDSTKQLTQATRQLFLAQDINRYLPARVSGFADGDDRLWTYRRLIEVEEQLHDLDDLKGGQIRIADFMKNGSKSAVMSNRALKVYIDHRSGGHVMELDYRPRRVNICATYASTRFEVPRIVTPGVSRTSFVDHVLAPDARWEDYAAGSVPELGDFVGTPFEYTVKKTSDSVKCVLVRNGSTTVSDKTLPLTMEKVFGLDRDTASLSFIYHLTNPSLIPLTCTLAIEVSLYLPGAEHGEAHIAAGKTTCTDLVNERFAASDLTRWSLVDHRAGMQIILSAQKPVDVWCWPCAGSGAGVYHGTTMMIVSRVELSGGTPWKLMGKLECRKARTKGKVIDAC